MSNKILGWLFATLFIIIGVLNMVLVHPVPGLFYLLLAVLYIPQVNVIMKQKLGFSIPLVAKIVLALVVLWGTLAVGDLAEILGL
jgi:1,4-dihydroxy-2-naphthoate octaprenyltransferase